MEIFSRVGKITEDSLDWVIIPHGFDQFWSTIPSRFFRVKKLLWCLLATNMLPG